MHILHYILYCCTQHYYYYYYCSVTIHYIIINMLICPYIFCFMLLWALSYWYFLPTISHDFDTTARMILQFALPPVEGHSEPELSLASEESRTKDVVQFPQNPIQAWVPGIGAVKQRCPLYCSMKIVLQKGKRCLYSKLVWVPYWVLQDISFSKWQIFPAHYWRLGGIWNFNVMSLSGLILQLTSSEWVTQTPQPWLATSVLSPYWLTWSHASLLGRLCPLECEQGPEVLHYPPSWTRPNRLGEWHSPFSPEVERPGVRK